MAVAACGLLLFLFGRLLDDKLPFVGFAVVVLGFGTAYLTSWCGSCGASLFATGATWPPREASGFFVPLWRCWPRAECSNCGAVQDG